MSKEVAPQSHHIFYMSSARMSMKYCDLIGAVIIVAVTQVRSYYL